MEDFYSAWLERSRQLDKTVSNAPRVAKGKSLNWVRTRQDSKASSQRRPPHEGDAHGRLGPSPAWFVEENFG